jgi:hypothetical protein
MGAPASAAKALMSALGLPTEDVDDDRAHEIHAAIEELGAACEGDDEDSDSEPMDDEDEEPRRKPKVGLLLSLGGKR